MKVKAKHKDNLIRTVTVYGSEFDFFMTSVSEYTPLSLKKVAEKEKSIAGVSPKVNT